LSSSPRSALRRYDNSAGARIERKSGRSQKFSSPTRTTIDAWSVTRGNALRAASRWQIQGFESEKLPRLVTLLAHRGQIAKLASRRAAARASSGAIPLSRFLSIRNLTWASISCASSVPRFRLLPSPHSIFDHHRCISSSLRCQNFRHSYGESLPLRGCPDQLLAPYRR
jgi:hypothetical protein